MARKVRFNHAVIPDIADIGAARQNGSAERLIRTIKQEKVDLSEGRSYRDVYGSMGRFLEGLCMHKRIRSSHGCLAPVESKD